MAIQLSPLERSMDRIVRSLIELIAGRSNSVIKVSLSINVTTTVVNFVNCSAECVPIPVPVTAHAAAEIGNGTMWISTVGNGSFTITHANNLQADRTFLFACIGG